MRYAELSINAMQSDRMITNNYDWKLFVLIFYRQKLSTINTIATTDLKIWCDYYDYCTIKPAISIEMWIVKAGTKY